MEAMAAIEARAVSCAHCGKQLLAPKRCSICKQIPYCGAECQKAGWKRHKKTCEPPLPLGEVREKVHEATHSHDWRGVLKWEGRMEELMEGRPDAYRDWTLNSFGKAHDSGYRSTGKNDHALAFIRLGQRRVELLGTLERFRHQSTVLCSIAQQCIVLGRRQEATTYFQRSRDLGAQHGFFSAESQACLGLGRLALREGRHEEGLALLRNALVASTLTESDESIHELNALRYLINSLFDTNGIDELEPLIPRHREAAAAQSQKIGRPKIGSAEVQSLCFSARLHEVL